MIDVPRVGGRHGGDHFPEILQRPVVVLGMGAPAFIALFQVTKFDPQNGPLDPVHPAIPPNHGMVIFADLALGKPGNMQVR